MYPFELCCFFKSTKNTGAVGTISSTKNCKLQVSCSWNSSYCVIQILGGFLVCAGINQVTALRFEI